MSHTTAVAPEILPEAQAVHAATEGNGWKVPGTQRVQEPISPDHPASHMHVVVSMLVDPNLQTQDAIDKLKLGEAMYCGQKTHSLSSLYMSTGHAGNLPGAKTLTSVIIIYLVGFSIHKYRPLTPAAHDNVCSSPFPVVAHIFFTPFEQLVLL